MRAVVVHLRDEELVDRRAKGLETFDKLPFYAALRVREVIVCDRDSKTPELFRLAGAQYVAVQRDPEGWLASETMRIRFLRVEARVPRLRVEDVEGGSSVEI